MSLDQEALDRASFELQRHFGREGSIYGIKACEEIARIAIVAYGAQASRPEEGTVAVSRKALEWLARQKLENDDGHDASIAMEAVAFAQRYIKPPTMNRGS
jgi:hypothetical protein